MKSFIDLFLIYRKYYSLKQWHLGYHNFLTINNNQKMKISKLFIMASVFAITTLSQAQDIKPNEVKKVLKKVADWQIDHFQDLYSGYTKPHHALDWTNGALYVGMVKWAAIADDDKYYNWLKKIEKNMNGNYTIANTTQMIIQ